MSRQDGDKNWLEERLSKLTERMWNTENYGDASSREITNHHPRMTPEEAEELKKYLSNPRRYVGEVRFKILENKLRIANEQAQESLDKEQQRYPQYIERPENYDHFLP